MSMKDRDWPPSVQRGGMGQGCASSCVAEGGPDGELGCGFCRRTQGPRDSDWVAKWY